MTEEHEIDEKYYIKVQELMDLPRPSLKIITYASGEDPT